MPKNSTCQPENKLLDLQFYFNAATQHAEDSGPDVEVGDLQAMMNVMWRLLSPAQRAAFARDSSVQDTLESADLDYEAKAPALLAAFPPFDNEVTSLNAQELNWFTREVMERYKLHGSAMVRLRDGTYAKVEFREAKPDKDMDACFVRHDGELRWHLNGKSLHSVDFDMMVMDD